MSHSSHTSSFQDQTTDVSPTSEPDGEPEKPPSAQQGLSEREALEAIQRGARRAGQQIDTRDDCAWLRLSAQPGLTLTTDALVEGVHFSARYDSFEQIGRQAAVVNLSDLASSGAWPLALLWSLSLPPSLSTRDLSALSEGFVSRCAQYNAQLLGGNICIRPGPLELHVSAIGAPSASRGLVSRSGAQVGDGVYVSGALGSRALGYLNPTPARRALRHRWRPHLHESRALCQWGGVSAMMDVSDGLLIDLTRLLEASELGAQIHTGLLPLSREASALVDDEAELLEAALSGGEDYVLLFTAPTAPPEALGCTRIGSTQRALGLWVDGAITEPRGYLHGAPSTPTTLDP